MPFNREPFVCPVLSITSCSHTFCKPCILHWLEISPTCPLDRTSMTSGDLHSAARIVTRLLDDLEVVCPLACGWSGARSEYRDHLQNHCPAVEPRNSSKAIDNTEFHLPLSHNRSQSTGLLSSRAGPMQHYRSAPSSPTSSRMPTLASRPSFPPRSVRFQLYPCPFAKFGCVFSAESSEAISKHMPECEAMLTSLKGTRESLQEERLKVHRLEQELSDLRYGSQRIRPFGRNSSSSSSLNSLSRSSPSLNQSSPGSSSALSRCQLCCRLAPAGGQWKCGLISALLISCLF